jgi:hypothetical protein
MGLVGENGGSGLRVSFPGRNRRLVDSGELLSILQDSGSKQRYRSVGRLQDTFSDVPRLHAIGCESPPIATGYAFEKQVIRPRLLAHDSRVSSTLWITTRFWVLTADGLVPHSDRPPFLFPSGKQRAFIT